MRDKQKSDIYPDAVSRNLISTWKALAEGYYAGHPVSKVSRKGTDTVTVETKKIQLRNIIIVVTI